MALIVNYTDKKTDCVSIGRNGKIKTIGVLITDCVEVVSITPITSKNSAGRAIIEIPKNDIPAVIGALKMAGEI